MKKALLILLCLSLTAGLSLSLWGETLPVETERTPGTDALLQNEETNAVSDLQESVTENQETERTSIASKLFAEGPAKYWFDQVQKLGYDLPEEPPLLPLEAFAPLLLRRMTFREAMETYGVPFQYVHILNVTWLYYYTADGQFLVFGMPGPKLNNPDEIETRIVFARLATNSDICFMLAQWNDRGVTAPETDVPQLSREEALRWADALYRNELKAMGITWKEEVPSLPLEAYLPLRRGDLTVREMLETYGFPQYGSNGGALHFYYSTSDGCYLEIQYAFRNQIFPDPDADISVKQINMPKELIPISSTLSQTP